MEPENNGFQMDFPLWQIKFDMDLYGFNTSNHMIPGGDW